VWYGLVISDILGQLTIKSLEFGREGYLVSIFAYVSESKTGFFRKLVEREKVCVI
jgi:hypothetical protein